MASCSTAKAFGGMPMLSEIMQVEGLLSRVSDPENKSRDDMVCYNSVFCAVRMHEQKVTPSYCSFSTPVILQHPLCNNGSILGGSSCRS